MNGSHYTLYNTYIIPFLFFWLYTPMTERTLANRLRIAIIEEVAKIDLPWFLFEHIDKGLLELNYFKLSNLYNNLEDYVFYLEEIQDNYVQFVKRHNPLLKNKRLDAQVYEPFMTDSLFNERYELYFNRQEMIHLESLFSVTCILRMKEFINRRILQHKNKQVASNKL